MHEKIMTGLAGRQGSGMGTSGAARQESADPLRRI